MIKERLRPRNLIVVEESIGTTLRITSGGETIVSK